jgi:hypothetical protein
MKRTMKRKNVQYQSTVMPDNLRKREHKRITKLRFLDKIKSVHS